MKKVLLRTAIVLIILLVAVSWSIYMRYDISLPEYIKYSGDFTSEEKRYLESKEAIIYAIDAKAPPLTFVDETTGNKKGLLIDYMRNMSLSSGIKVEYRPTEFYNVLKMLKTGEADMSDVFESEERSQFFAFTQPLYQMKGVAVCLAERADNRKIESLNGTKIAVAAEDYVIEYLKRQYDEEDITIISFDDIEIGMKNLAEGEVDVVAGDVTVIHYYAKKLGIEENIKQVGNDLYSKDVTFAVKKDNKLLLNILNREILGFKKKNVLVQSQEKWFGRSSAPTIMDINSLQWIEPVIYVGLILLMLFLIWEGILEARIKEKTKEIEIQKDKLRTIIDSVQSALLVIDRSGSITEHNKPAVNIFNDNSIINKNTGEVSLLNSLIECFEEGKKQPFKIGERYYYVNAVPMCDEPGSKLIIVADDTDRTLAERKIRQKSKLIEMGQLSAGLAHEIRNPLGIIKNYSYILRTNEDKDVLEHGIETIDESVDRINELVNNLLRFSKISGDSKKQINIRELIESIVKLQQKKLEKFNIKTEINCNEGLTAFSNEETLKITLFNLLNNSIEAFDEIKSKNNYIRISSEKCNNDSLRITVTDNGKGISEKQMESIYNPFYTTKESGTGLGLYIVNAELQKINGNIVANSIPFEKTVFTITIPSCVGTEEENDKK